MNNASSKPKDSDIKARKRESTLVNRETISPVVKTLDLKRHSNSIAPANSQQLPIEKKHSKPIDVKHLKKSEKVDLIQIPKHDKSRPLKETKLKQSHSANDTIKARSSSSGSQTSSPTTLTSKSSKKKIMNIDELKSPVRARRMSIDPILLRRQSIDPSQFKSYAELQQAMHVMNIDHERSKSTHSDRQSSKTRLMSTIPQNDSDESENEHLAQILLRQQQKQDHYHTVQLPITKPIYQKCMDINFMPPTTSEKINNDDQSIETVIQDEDDIPLAFLGKMKNSYV